MRALTGSLPASRLARLSDAVRAHVRPGMHLHFASTPSRSNAAIREVARAFLGQRPGFKLSSTGFHSMAHLLPMLRLAESLAGAFFGDHYPAPRPNPLYTRLVASGVALEQWSLWSLVSALRAGAQGDPWAFNRSLAGTTIAAELERRGAYREVPDPRDPRRPIGLCAAIRPDLTFVHAAAGDEDGNVILSGPMSEGMWSALGARHGVIVTVERIAPPAWTRQHPDLVILPPHRVLAVCEEPLGAHPQAFHCAPAMGIPSYRDDVEHYELWRGMTTDEAALGDFVERVLRAAPSRAGCGDAYREWVGHARVDALRVAPTRRGQGRAWTPIIGAPAPANQARRAKPGLVRDPRAPSPAWAVEHLIVAGARRLAARARAIRARVLLAGIGHAFFAARLAQRQLAAEGFELRVMVETGLYDIECGPTGHGYLLAYDNIAQARRLTSIDDVLGVLGCGADNKCLAALGAAQIDRHPNLNSSRLADGRILVGSGGACDIAAGVEEVVVLTRLAPGRLVHRLDYVTSPGRAVRSIVTDRGTLRRDGACWYLDALAPARPGADLEQELGAFLRDCPWNIELPEILTFDAAVSGVESQLLTALDPDGTYRHRAS